MYLAQDTKLDRRVALKILPSDLATNQDRAAVVLVSAAVALGLYKLGILSGADGAVTFSPDGKRFAFLRSSGTKESALIVVSPDGTGEQKLSSPNAPDTTS